MQRAPNLPELISREVVYHGLENKVIEWRTEFEATLHEAAHENDVTWFCSPKSRYGMTG